MNSNLHPNLKSSLLALSLALLPWAGGALAADSVPTPIATALPPDLQDQAAQAFEKGDFTTAVADYEQMVKAGTVNGHLYYNLGIAYFRLGRTGAAMAAFLGARRFLPRDPDTAANLRFVLANVHDKLEAEVPQGFLSRIGFWLDRFTLAEFAWATSAFFGLWGAALTAVLLAPRFSRARVPVLVGIVVPLFLLASAFAKAGEQQVWGAVDQAKAKVYSGPATINPVVFELQEGAPVLVTEVAAGGFYRIQLSDGKKGWIPDSQVKVFGPL